MGGALFSVTNLTYPPRSTLLTPKALKCGAIKCVVEDLCEEFVKDYVWPAVKSNAIYESR